MFNISKLKHLSLYHYQQQKMRKAKMDQEQEQTREQEQEDLEQERQEHHQNFVAFWYTDFPGTWVSFHTYNLGQNILVLAEIDGFSSSFKCCVRDCSFTPSTTVVFTHYCLFSQYLYQTSRNYIK